MTIPAPEPLIRVAGVSKSYVGVRALDGVSLDIAPGEIHALCGENGAGKSTLIKVLAGSVLPDAGSVFLAGQPLPLGNVRASEHAGIAVIHQESVAFPHLNAQDNIFVGREPRRAGFLLDRRRMLAETRTLMARLGEDIDPRKPVGDLPMAQRQMVGMARALSHKCRLLIMDEPTASLSTRETEVLFRIIRQLQAEGVSILYVSHRLEEIFLLSDRVTVFRDGKHVGTRLTKEIGQDELIHMMVGRELLQVEGAVKAATESAGGAVLLDVQGLTRAGIFRDISFSVRKGEIVGMAGLVGAGRSEVARAIFGADPVNAGTVTVAGKPLTPNSIDAAMRAGIALVPEDRQHLGLIFPMTVGENLSMAVLGTLTRLGLISSTRERNLAREQIENLHVKTASAGVAAQTLSGGNQQKLVIGKWLAARPRVLILDEPTRGVDVGAKAEIYKLIRTLAESGLAVLVISSDLPEVLLLSDRILVMRGGLIAGQLHRAAATQEKILALAMPVASGRGGGRGMTTLDYQRGKRRLRPVDLAWALISKREYGLVILLALIFIVVTIRSPDFASRQNLRDILANCSQVAVISCGVMLVIITKEIDISVGSALGFLTAILGTLVAPTNAPIPGFGWPVWAGILITLAIGTGIGLLNGLLVTLVRIPSIIVTLAMLMILKSLTTMIMHRGNLSNFPDSLSFFGIGTFLGIIMPIWIMAAVALATWLLIRYTPVGRRIYAVGSNENAAALSGLSVTRIKIFAFALTGLLVGVATIITQLATFDSGIGNGMELLVVTCIVVGGVSISGGQGTVLGVFLGVLLLSIQKTFLIFLKLGPGWSNWDKAIQGGLILAAVLIDHIASRRTGCGSGGRH